MHQHIVSIEGHCVVDALEVVGLDCFVLAGISNGFAHTLVILHLTKTFDN